MRKKISWAGLIVFFFCLGFIFGRGGKKNLISANGEKGLTNQVLQASTIQPANPHASEDTRKLLKWIAGLPNRSENRVISGQQTGASAWPSSMQENYQNFVVNLHTATGKWVAMIGADYGGYGEEVTADDISYTNQFLIDYWNNDGLVTLDYSANNPWTINDDDPATDGSCWDTSQRDLEELIDSNSEVHDTWIEMLDKVAVGLTELRDAGVVVLWRPFHESTFKDTFWWDSGAHGGYWGDDSHWRPNKEPFLNLWKHMFDYFTNTKGLNNLIWIYCAADTEGWHYVDSMYPGDTYVDIVGVDIYSDSTQINGYQRLVDIGKTFALTETGPAFGVTKDGSWDTTTIINSIKNRYPQTTYFLVWGSWEGHKVAIVDNQNAADLLNDPWVITRDEVDWQSVDSPTPTPGLANFKQLLLNWLTSKFDQNGDKKVNNLDFGRLVIGL